MTKEKDNKQQQDQPRKVGLKTVVMNKFGIEDSRAIDLQPAIDAEYVPEDNATLFGVKVLDNGYKIDELPKTEDRLVDTDAAKAGYKYFIEKTDYPEEDSFAVTVYPACDFNQFLLDEAKAEEDRWAEFEA